MATRILSLRFSDIIEAIANIRGVVDDLPIESFEQRWEKRWLVERGIEIISEASRVLPLEIQASRPEIPWTRVRDIGNVLRHGIIAFRTR